MDDKTNQNGILLIEGDEQQVIEELVELGCTIINRESHRWGPDKTLHNCVRIDVDKEGFDLVLDYSTNRVWYGSTDGCGKYITWYDGRKESEGFMEGGVRVGKWRFWYPSGEIQSECSYKGGNREGLFRRWFESGKLSEETTYSDGVKTGNSITWWENGQIRSKTDFVGVDSIGKELYRENTRWYENGQVEHTSNWRIINEQTLQMVKDGEFITFYENGNINCYETYLNGKKDGLKETCFSDGQPREELHYVEGKRDGKYQSWYKNGNVSSIGEYKLGKRIGVWTRWDENGDKMYEGVYKDGELSEGFITSYVNQKYELYPDGTDHDKYWICSKHYTWWSPDS